MQKKWLPDDHAYWAETVASALRFGSNFQNCANRVCCAIGSNGENVIVKAYVNHHDDKPVERDVDMEHAREVRAYGQVQKLRVEVVPQMLGCMRSVVNGEYDASVVLLSEFFGKTLFECTECERAGVRTKVFGSIPTDLGLRDIAW